MFQDGDTEEFRITLRMDKKLYKYLFKLLESALTKKTTNCRPPIPAKVRLALTMRFLALGDGFLSLSQQFRVGLSTVSEIVRHTCKAIISVMGRLYLVTPRSTEAWLAIAADYERTWNMPHILGSVDGKHIRISKPRGSGSLFYNYKDFCSIVLLGIASADYRFLYIDVGAEGKASDGGIWSKCSFYQCMIHRMNPLNLPYSDNVPGMGGRVPYFLIGDDAFPLGPRLMKPFSGIGLTRRQNIFNYRLSRCRRVIENTFGILACRFRIFRKTIEVQPEFVKEIVMASCILHNFLRVHAGSEYIPPGMVDQEMVDGNMVAGTWRQEGSLMSMKRSVQRNAADYAKRIRNNLADYFLTPEGEVEWQYRMVANI